MTTGYVITRKGGPGQRGIYIPEHLLTMYTSRGGNPSVQLNAFTMMSESRVHRGNIVGLPVEVPEDIIMFAIESVRRRDEEVADDIELSEEFVSSGDLDLPPSFEDIGGILRDSGTDYEAEEEEMVRRVEAIVAAAITN